MPVNPTDEEIDTEIDKIEQKLHDEFSVPPEIYVRLEALIKYKARTDAIADMEGRNEIHEKYHELNDKGIETKAHSEGYKEGQKDASKEIFDFEDYWNLGIYTDDLDQKEINRYYRERQKLLEKYNYKV